MYKNTFKKAGAVILAVTFSVSSFLCSSVSAESNFNYKDALKKSIQFYDANKCGENVANDNVFDWRDACHTTDGQDVALDLTGGFHDAGDHVKFGITQGYSASTLGWSLYESKDAYCKTGNSKKLLSTLKYFTDFFLKSHPEKDVFYYNIGDGNIDHAYWGSPEAQQGSRPTMSVTGSTYAPASDICGITSAALSQMYLNYRNIDRKYAKRCLKAAKELYTMGKNNPGKSPANSYYPSFSYEDDMSWAAIWLYMAEKDKRYLNDVKGYIYKEDGTPKESFFKNTWAMCWDDMSVPVMLMMAKITGKKEYKDAVEFNLNYWMENVATTPGGLKYLTPWGSLRYAANESLIALIYCKINRDPSLKAFAKSQIDYILGNNPNQMSYVIGFGDKYPLQPHHRAASGTDTMTSQPAKHTLTGALVGGPNQDDSFNDNTANFVSNEVSIDYNAGLVGALAEMSKSCR